MLAVTIIAVGKLKEQYLRDAVLEYSKRIAGYYKFEVIEIAESKLSQKPSQAEIVNALYKEGELILERIPKRAKTVALCIEGKQYSSQAFAEIAAGIEQESSHLVFIIGSSHGIAENVKCSVDMRLSMSKMTFSHQIARIMLCEQIYRMGSILNGGKYHK